MPAALQRFALLLAGILVAGCPSPATKSSQAPTTRSQPPAAPAAVPDSGVRGPVSCRTAVEPAQRRACGTAEIVMEYPLEIGISRLTYISMGENAPEVSRHIDSANRHIANARSVRPEAAADILRAGADALRRSALEVCRLEGKPPTPGDSIRSDFLKAYVWLEYRISLIERARGGFRDRIDRLLADPCFESEGAAYFEAAPKALVPPGRSFYALPSYFARALSYYHARRGAPLASDAYGFRAELGEAGEEQLACLRKEFAAEDPGGPGASTKLWDLCLRITSKGESCLATWRRCTPLKTPSGRTG
jgi:hypothetical protein